MDNKIKKEARCQTRLDTTRSLQSTEQNLFASYRYFSGFFVVVEEKFAAGENAFAFLFSLKISKDTKDEFARLVRFVREESEEDDTFLSKTLFSPPSFSLSARGGRPVFEAGVRVDRCCYLFRFNEQKSNDDASLFFPNYFSQV